MAALALVPDLIGGSGSLGQPSFLTAYNLTEVTSYVGILPLVAAFALLGRLRLRQRPPDWLVWHVAALVGVVLALGSNTPLGGVLYHLPLFGDQRLQSRNVLVLDLALAVLLAYWADQPFPAGLASRARIALETALGAVPPLAVIALVAAGLTWGAGLLQWLGVSTSTSVSAIGRLQPFLVPYAVLGAGAVALVIFGRRLGPRLRARLLVGFVVVDLVVFSVLGVVEVAPGGFGGIRWFVVVRARPRLRRAGLRQPRRLRPRRLRPGRQRSGRLRQWRPHCARSRRSGIRDVSPFMILTCSTPVSCPPSASLTLTGSAPTPCHPSRDTRP